MLPNFPTTHAGFDELASAKLNTCRCRRCSGNHTKRCKIAPHRARTARLIVAQLPSRRQEVAVVQPRPEVPHRAGVVVDRRAEIDGQLAQFSSILLRSAPLPASSKPPVTATLSQSQPGSGQPWPSHASRSSSPSMSRAHRKEKKNPLRLW